VIRIESTYICTDKPRINANRIRKTGERTILRYTECFSEYRKCLHLFSALVFQRIGDEICVPNAMQV
jgi:hypothetical protein